MNLLQAKGHLARKAGERAQVYAPTQPKQKVVRHMVDEFVRRVFDGSAKPLLAHLIEDGSLSEKERRALQRLVDGMRHDRAGFHQRAGLQHPTRRPGWGIGRPRANTGHPR